MAGALPNFFNRQREHFIEDHALVTKLFEKKLQLTLPIAAKLDSASTNFDASVDSNDFLYQPNNRLGLSSKISNNGASMSIG